MPAHCRSLMAEVPESVSRSIYTSRERRRNVLYPASTMALSRCTRVGMRTCSTILILKGSAQLLCSSGMATRYRSLRRLTISGSGSGLGRRLRSADGRGDLHVGGDVLPVRQLVDLAFRVERHGQLFGFIRPYSGSKGEAALRILLGFLGASPHGDVAGQAVDIRRGVVDDQELHHRRLVLGIAHEAYAGNFDIFL